MEKFSYKNVYNFEGQLTVGTVHSAYTPISKLKIGTVIQYSDYGHSEKLTGRYGHITGFGCNQLGELLIECKFEGVSEPIELHPSLVYVVE